MFRAKLFKLVMLIAVGLPAARGRAAEAPRDPAAVAADIDRMIEERLTKAGVPASPVADDAEFLRRVSLDLAGRIPTLDQATRFLDGKEPDRRRKLIDSLLSGRDHAQHLATVWRNLLAPPNPVKGKAAPDRFTPWLADQLQRNRGWGQI